MKKVLLLAFMALGAAAYASDNIPDITGSYFKTPPIRLYSTKSKIWDSSYLSFTKISILTINTTDDCVKLIPGTGGDHNVVDLSKCTDRKLEGQFDNGTEFTILF